MKTKRISLLFELENIINALAAVRIMSAELGSDQFATVEDFRAAPACIESLSILVTERLRLLSRAIRDEVDPRLLWCPDNSVLRGIEDAPEFKDIIITGWSAKRRRREAQAELRRVAKSKRRRSR